VTGFRERQRGLSVIARDQPFLENSAILNFRQMSRQAAAVATRCTGRACRLARAEPDRLAGREARGRFPGRESRLSPAKHPIRLPGRKSADVGQSGSEPPAEGAVTGMDSSSQNRTPHG
jgi:hypothetical protein